MRNHHATSVLVGDYLYGFSDAILMAMKFDSGQVAWRDRSVGKGSVVVCRRPPVSLQRTGRGRAGRGQPRGYREHGRFQIRAGSLPTWSHPIVSNGKLFIRDQDNIYAYDVRQK